MPDCAQGADQAWQFKQRSHSRRVGAATPARLFFHRPLENGCNRSPGTTGTLALVGQVRPLPALVDRRPSAAINHLHALRCGGRGHYPPRHPLRLYA